MGKKWKRTLVRRRKEAGAEPAPAPVVSNSEMIERLKITAPAPEPEVVEEAPAVETEPVVEAPKPKRRRTSARRKKTVSED